MFGHLGIGQRLGARSDAVSVELHPTQRSDATAGRDDNALGRQLCVAVLRMNDDRIRPRKFAVARVARHLVLFQQEGHALSQRADDLVFTLQHFGQVELDPGYFDPKSAQAVFGLVIMLAGLQ